MTFFSRLFRRPPEASKAVPEAAPPTARMPLPEAVPVHEAAVEREQRAASDAAALQAAIAAGDRAGLAALVLGGASTHVRQQAARAIEDPAQLRDLIRQVRGGRDNGVYRILTAKRDELLAQTRRSEQQQAEVDSVIGALERHVHRPYDALFVPTLEQLRKRWESVSGRARADQAQAATQHLQRCEELIARQAREAAESAARHSAEVRAAAQERARRDAAAAVAASAVADQQRAAAAQREAQIQAAQVREETLGKIAALLRQAHGALNAGRSRRAATLRATLTETLQASPPLPPRLSTQLQQLDARLQEIKDWKSFSVTPKRAQLLAEMQALIGASLAPLALAKRVTELREQWRTLDRGASEVEPPLEEPLFQEAAEKAYQPCREYFAQQASLSRENQQRRAALVRRLQDFVSGQDWEQPDWKLVSTVLREAQELWRAAAPADKDAGVAEQFRRLTSDLKARLDAQYTHNTERKRRLIVQARALLASEDSRAAIESVRSLQQQWRQVGMVPRSTDQQLWEEFREHCDAIFQRRQQEYAEYTAGLERNREAALAVCAELERLAAEPDGQLLIAGGRSAELAAAFAAAGEFPRATARSLQQRFERAMERCEQAQRQARRHQEELRWDNVFSAAQRLQALRRAAAAAPRESEEHARLREDAERFVAATTPWPPGFTNTFRAELDRATATDAQLNERALRELCIRAEVLTDSTTPPEDTALRREYQMQRLVQGMGQRPGSDPRELDRLTLEWLGAGPVNESTYEQLLARFRRCRSAGVPGLTRPES